MLTISAPLAYAVMFGLLLRSDYTYPDPIVYYRKPGEVKQ